VAHYVLFFPGQVVTERLLENADLAKVSDGQERYEHTEHGPEGGGVVVGWPNSRPADQWKKDDKYGYWIGTRSGDAPNPVDLRRQHTYGGFDVAMADGLLWHLPCYKSMQTVMRYVDGELQETWPPEHREFADRCQDAEAVLTTMGLLNGDPDRPEHDVDLLEIVLEALQINYKLTPRLIAHLGLINTRSLQAAILVVLGAFSQDDSTGIVEIQEVE